MVFVEKSLHVLPPLTIAGRHVKRYHVSAASTEIEPAIEKAAYDFLPQRPDPDNTPRATFVVLHRAETAAYLNAYSWVWNNVIYCGVAVAGIPFLGCPDDDPTHFIKLDRPWIGCVWELPALGHEPSAWVQHMIEPAEPDLDAYLADVLPSGPTGG
ncbi:MAG: hypothetical protein ACRDVZ_13645 [Jiangellaceae bacterium]